MVESATQIETRARRRAQIADGVFLDLERRNTFNKDWAVFWFLMAVTVALVFGCMASGYFSFLFLALVPAAYSIGISNAKTNVRREIEDSIKRYI